MFGSNVCIWRLRLLIRRQSQTGFFYCKGGSTFFWKCLVPFPIFFRLTGRKYDFNKNQVTWISDLTANQILCAMFLRLEAVFFSWKTSWCIFRSFKFKFSFNSFLNPFLEWYSRTKSFWWRHQLLLSKFSNIHICSPKNWEAGSRLSCNLFCKLLPLFLS